MTVNYPETFEKFISQYQYIDEQMNVIPVYRVMQGVDHYAPHERLVKIDVKKYQSALDNIANKSHTEKDIEMLQHLIDKCRKKEFRTNEKSL